MAASNRQRATQARQRKQKKRQEKNRLARARAVLERSPRSRMQAVALGPVRDCLMNRTWRDEAFAVVLLSREGPDGVASVVFHVDLERQGVEESLVSLGLTESTYAELVQRLQGHNHRVEPCDPSLAVKLVRTAVDNAHDFGFRPHKDYALGREIFGDLDPGACTEEIPCGPREAEFDPPRGDAHEIETWQRLHQANRQLVGDIVEEAMDRFDGDMAGEAWDEFCLARKPFPPSPADDLDFDTAFLPWFVFNWIAKPAKRDEETADWPTTTLAARWLAESREFLDDTERALIEELDGKPFSFHSVLALTPGRGVLLRDIFTGVEREILDVKLSGSTRRGTILFGRVLTLEGVSILCGCSMRMLPPSLLGELIELRERIADHYGDVSDEAVANYEFELHEAHFVAAEIQDDPRPPVLQNTDGEQLAPVTLEFRLSCSVDEAVAALRTLAGEIADDDDLLTDVVVGKRGELRSASFPWLGDGNKQHANWTNTHLGLLSFNGQSLSVEVNSRERADRIRPEIEQRLGERVRFESEVAQSAEEFMAKYGAKAPGELSPPRSAVDDLSPEDSKDLTDALVDFMAAHWESWLDEEIPALGHRTPREAATTEQGRELLEALLADYEWKDAAMERARPGPGNVCAADVPALRAKLGLGPRPGE